LTVIVVLLKSLSIARTTLENMPAGFSMAVAFLLLFSVLSIIPSLQKLATLPIKVFKSCKVFSIYNCQICYLQRKRWHCYEII